jgi:hypothetical protein
MGQCKLELGHAADAVRLLERALAITTAQADDPLITAPLQFLLARALTAVGGARGRARALAEAARETYAAQGPPAAAQLAEVARWLQHQPAGPSAGRP